jgi:hypothetical protein
MEIDMSDHLDGTVERLPVPNATKKRRHLPAFLPSDTDRQVTTNSAALSAAGVVPDEYTVANWMAAPAPEPSAS